MMDKTRLRYQAPPVRVSDRGRRSRIRRTEDYSKNSFISKVCISGFIAIMVFVSSRINTPFTNNLNESTKTLVTTNTSVEGVKETYYQGRDMLARAVDTVNRINGAELKEEETEKLQGEAASEEPSQTAEDRPVYDGDDGIIIDAGMLEEINEEEGIYESLQKK